MGSDTEEKEKHSKEKNKDKLERSSSKKDRKEKEERGGKEKRDKERDSKKDREREKERDREREKDRDRDRERDREREREREARERETREREREQKKEREKKEREREREREKRKRTTRSRRTRSRSGTSSPSSPESAPEDDHRSNKRRKDDASGSKPERKRRTFDEDTADDPPSKGEEPVVLSAEDLEEQRKAEEAAKLEAAAEKRRKRIEAWQEERRKKTEEEERAHEEAIEKEKASRKQWTLDGDDSDDEEEQKPLQTLDDDSDENNQAENGETKDEVQDEEEEDPLDAFMNANQIKPLEDRVESHVAKVKAKATKTELKEDEEIDPLDAFMATSIAPEVERLEVLNKQPEEGGDEVMKNAEEDEEKAVEEGYDADNADNGVSTPIMKIQMKIQTKKKSLKNRRRTKAVQQRRGGLGMASGQYADTSSEEESDDEEELKEETETEWKARALAGKPSKADKLSNVDHSAIEYEAFRSNFYIEASEISKMADDDVKKLRSELDGIKCRGKSCPKPIKSWTQCGLSNRVLDVIKKAGFEKPLAIQCQALPVIMSGRDCIGVAKTGSGKTLAFVLPLMRHVKDQRPLAQGDGMIGLIMAPTRELIAQIAREAKKFAKPMGMNVVAVYGGSGVAQQISELKRGAEIVVATPGRLIDILATGTGKITNLRRVTYLVLDEADRMFDMGFEPQIERIIINTRSDRQSVMFSATFPRQVELLAKKVLNDPVEIQIGGRSVVNPDVDQQIEIRPEEDQFLRLLELLGEWYEMGKVLVFVHSQDKCDTVFRDLLKSGYPCLSLHGGKDQSDRESTVADFKGNVCNVLIATSVAARGLDVKDLNLVVNYDVPNHYEDYVHRVGRTGRAGTKGTAVTFISPDEEKYAADLVRALSESGRTVPADLKAMAVSFEKQKKEGLVQAHGTGYGGTGFKFDAEEADKKKQDRKQKARQYGINEDDDDVFSSDGSDAEEDTIRASGTLSAHAQAAASASAAAASLLGDQTGMTAPGGFAGFGPHAGAMALAAANAANQPLHPVALAGVRAAAAATAAAAAAAAGYTSGALIPAAVHANPFVAAAQAAAAKIAAGQSADAASAALVAAQSGVMTTAAAKAAAFAAALSAAHGKPALAPEKQEQHFETELEINDFPQHARWKVTHKDALNQICEWTGAAITTRGQFYAPNKAPPPGERKLYLLIEGASESSVRKAKQEIKTILETTMESITSLQGGYRGGQAPGKYNVM